MKHLMTVLRLLLFCVLQGILSVWIAKIKAEGAELLLLILSAGLILLCISVFFFAVTCILCRQLPRGYRMICPAVMGIASFCGIPLAFVRFFVDTDQTAAVLSAMAWGIAALGLYYCKPPANPG